MILISGEALIDLIPDPERPNVYDAVLGGSPYNVAIGLTRLGSHTAFVSRISRDGNGDALASALSDNSVDLGYVLRDQRPSTLAFVMRGTAKTGSRYAFYLDATSFDGPWPFPTDWPEAGSHLHLGSISAVDARHGERAVGAMKSARERATVSYDPNIRPLVTPDRDSVAPLVERQVGAGPCGEGQRRRPSMAISGPFRGRLSGGLGGCRAALLRRHARRARRDRDRRKRADPSAGPRNRSRRHRRRRRQLHVGAARGYGQGLGAWRRFVDAGSSFPRTLASIRGCRIGDHLHTQGLEPAHPLRGRHGA